MTGLARAVFFLWPDRWTRTRRGLRLCVIATFGLAGALTGGVLGVIAGLCLLAAGIRVV